ncbi:MarR family 2-MHQ and catechol resistance regulon transcriptional repressor [Archangium gephyra]|uniref:MarR family 2-MHQ and catechol resistance regulon transcriptional repressor n=1 Tax=Archangium gephyra TaxID=48 RepID=A0ABX9K9E7_9BACT|nr:MarR family transcriptional regulator [Archangium gephyra]REG36032.1 MarR family 2-MHQ and catechol resistance regulon transcriptional repressor [Archangium gephyra]
MPTRYKGSAREVRALDTFVKLTRATETLGTQLQRHLASLEITPPQLAVLEALLHVGPMSQSELGRKLLRSNPNMTALLDNLERNKWIQRERSPEDRRVVVVSLTPEGRRVIERVFPAHAAHVTALLGGLSAEEQETLGTLCKKLGLSLSEG